MKTIKDGLHYETRDSIAHCIPTKKFVWYNSDFFKIQSVIVIRNCHQTKHMKYIFKKYIKYILKYVLVFA
jgi:hypothetical protein